MFNPERLLGSLVTSALSGGLGARPRRRKGSRRAAGLAGQLLGRNKAAIGMGLLGLAVGAFEHFSQRSQTGGDPPPPSLPGGGAGNPPPGPPPSWTPPPIPEQRPLESPEETSRGIVVLVRAMVAAANADHTVDEVERKRILSKLEGSGLTDEERAFLTTELENPVGMRALIDQVTSPKLAEEVYVASLLAIDVDSDAERNYLKRLAQGLGLDETAVKRWNEQFGAGES
ncbi:MAG: DUF533 domain-containing protein [Acidobacteriota bacterium]